MTIGFIQPGNALLPEIDAYISFFSSYQNIKTCRISSNDPLPQNIDVEWVFMGTQYKKINNVITIHEYASSSTPPFLNLKNWIKKKVNAEPDFRVFFSESVYQYFLFKDNVPFGFRGHGVLPLSHFSSPKVNYDFVYVGTTSPARKLDPLFESFRSGLMKNKSLLVVSNDHQKNQIKFKNCKNITFKGPVPYHNVYPLIQEARYGINYIPDTPPFNRQISAKLIDYSACRIPIISTNYEWVRSFQKSFGGQFFFLEKDLINFTWENVNDFPYEHANVSNLTWKNQIEGSGVILFLKQKFPESFK